MDIIPVSEDSDFFKKKEDGTIGKEPGRVIFAAAEQGTIATVLAV